MACLEAWTSMGHCVESVAGTKQSRERTVIIMIVIVMVIVIVIIIIIII